MNRVNVLTARPLVRLPSKVGTRMFRTYFSNSLDYDGAFGLVRQDAVQGSPRPRFFVDSLQDEQVDGEEADLVRGGLAKVKQRYWQG